MPKNKKISRRKFIKIASASGVALGLSGLKGSYSIGAAEKKPIKIGAAMPLTGRHSRQSISGIEGYKLWAKNINERGSSFGNEHLPHKEPGLIDGRPVELILLDDASDPTTGARLYMELIYGKKVDLLLGPYSSGITTAVKPIIEAAGIPTVCPMASSQHVWLGQKLNWIAQVMSPGFNRFAGLEVVCKEAGYSKIAIPYVDDAMAIAAVEGLHKRAKEAGLDVVMYEPYPIGVRDLVPVIRKVRDAGAEILAGGGFVEDGILMAKAALSLRWEPKVFWHMGDFSYPDIDNALGVNAAWMCGDGEWLPEANWPGNKGFVEAYKKEFGKVPEYIATEAYAGCQILEDAVKRVGSIEEKEAIRDLIFSMERDTVFGHFKVNPVGHPDAGLQIAATRMALQAHLENGKIVKKVIWPPVIATGKFVHPFHWGKM